MKVCKNLTQKNVDVQDEKVVAMVKIEMMILIMMTMTMTMTLDNSEKTNIG